VHSIGIIGAGRIARVHAANAVLLGGLRVAVAADVEPDAARAIADELACDVAGSVEELFARADVEAVLITTPPATHADLVVAAAAAGKHVFCEKPLARTIEQARAIVDAADEAGVRVAVGHVVRVFPEYVRVKEILASGELGRPGIATLTRGSFSVATARPWYQDPARSGGVILDLMLHDLDVLRWWFGEPDRVSGKRLTGRGGALDYALATLRWPDGPIAHVEASWAEHDGFRTAFEVRGERGMLAHDSRKASPVSTQIPGGPSGPAMIPLTTVHETPYARQMRSLVDRLARGDEPLVSGREGLRSLALALTVIKAADAGEVIRWEPPS
jgi:predicted dehydrogenase